MLSRLLSLFLLVLVAVSAFSAYRLLEATLAAEVYKTRLGEIASDYEQLRDSLRELANEQVPGFDDPRLPG